MRRLLLTCSGGPFFGRSLDELEHVTAADALKHPNWTMGAKITIDSRHPDEQGAGDHRGHAAVPTCRWSRWRR